MAARESTHHLPRACAVPPGCGERGQCGVSADNLHGRDWHAGTRLVLDEVVGTLAVADDDELQAGASCFRAQASGMERDQRVSVRSSFACAGAAGRRRQRLKTNAFTHGATADMDHRNARAPSPGSGIARPLYGAFSACKRIAPEHRPVTVRAERRMDMEQRRDGAISTIMRECC